MTKLTPKQKAFVDAYCGNAAEAAVKAGYSKKTAKAIGAENLTKPNIAAAIQARQDKESNRRIADRQERQGFWSATMQDEAADMKDRLRASELLGKSEGDFIDRHELTGRDGGAIEHTVTPEVMGFIERLKGVRP